MNVLKRVSQREREREREKAQKRTSISL